MPLFITNTLVDCYGRRDLASPGMSTCYYPAYNRISLAVLWPGIIHTFSPYFVPSREKKK